MENLHMASAICKILVYRTYKKLFHVTDTPLKPTYDVIALGFNGVGKSTCLAAVSGEEDMESIEPTQGFAIKAVTRPQAILNIKEIGGSISIRPYWNRYYDDNDGVMFFVDSTITLKEVWKAIADVLREVLSHQLMDGLPLLVMANKQDIDGATSCEDIVEMLMLNDICKNRTYMVHPCSSKTPESIALALDKFITALPPIEIHYDDNDVDKCEKNKKNTKADNA